MCNICNVQSMKENISTSLYEFSRLGGSTSDHEDGWGIVFYEEGGVHFLHKSQVASSSIYLDFICNREFNSKIFIYHIRKATQGEVTLRNTHPFVREMITKMHVFAYNGKLGAFDQEQKLTGRFQPVEESDSEFSFCYLLDALAPLWQTSTVPDLDKRMDVISKFAKKIWSYGPANFIYADRDVFICSWL